MMSAGHSYLLVSWTARPPSICLCLSTLPHFSEHCANNVTKWLCDVDLVWQGNRVVVGMKLSI